MEHSNCFLDWRWSLNGNAPTRMEEREVSVAFVFRALCLDFGGVASMKPAETDLLKLLDTHFFDAFKKSRLGIGRIARPAALRRQA